MKNGGIHSLCASGVDGNKKASSCITLIWNLGDHKIKLRRLPVAPSQFEKSGDSLQ